MGAPVELGEAQVPGGPVLRLMRRGAEYLLFADGGVLMSSRVKASEQALARDGLAPIVGRPRPRVAIGGLGMGFTLRAALDALPADASVVVCELFEAVVDWNRGELGLASGQPLADPRVQVHVGDVLTWLARQRGLDAVLLDVDNGPEAFTTAENRDLYGLAGLATVAAALAPGGVAAFWSAWHAPGFVRSLEDVGLKASAVAVRAGGAGRGATHRLFLGIRPGRR